VNSRRLCLAIEVEERRRSDDNPVFDGRESGDRSIDTAVIKRFETNVLAHGMRPLRVHLSKYATNAQHGISAVHTVGYRAPSCLERSPSVSRRAKGVVGIPAARPLSRNLVSASSGPIRRLSLKTFICSPLPIGLATWVRAKIEGQLLPA